MSVCEAMACGKAVAAYQGGSVAEVVGHAGLIVETGDLEGLTVAVGHLVQDGELRSALGRKARERVVMEFDPVNSLKQLESIYRSLLLRTAKP
jgi:glycosyltransferase involved in cell wall biosynthesis